MDNQQGVPLVPQKGVVIKGSLIPAALIGLAVAGVTIALAYIIPAAATYLGNSLLVGQMFTTISVIVVLLIYGLVLIAPALWFGAKEGWKAAVWVIVFEVVWLIILAFSAVVLFSQPTVYHQITPANCGRYTNCLESD